jgi:hypothetical protein
MTLATKIRRRVKSRKQERRNTQIDAVAGRYANVPTSSERFAAEKRRELAREGGRR